MKNENDACVKVSYNKLNLYLVGNNLVDFYESLL